MRGRQQSCGQCSLTDVTSTPPVTLYLSYINSKKNLADIY